MSRDSAAEVRTVTQATVAYHRQDEVAFLTLDRPSSLNALDARMRAELPAAVNAAQRDPLVRVIVLRGAGRAFCAGVDLTERGAAESLVEARERKQLPRVTHALLSASKPTVAAVQGYCFGVGVELALACDLLIASTDAEFALPEVGLGMPGGAQRLLRVAGIGHALAVGLTGRRVSAGRAYELGYVIALTEPAELESTTQAWALRLRDAPPDAVAFAKEAVRRAGELSLEAGLRLEHDLATMLLATRDPPAGTCGRDR